MMRDKLQPLVWPSLHSELSGLVVTEECMLSHCCDSMLHHIPDDHWSWRVLNDTDWCHANLNMTMCNGDHPPVLPPSSCYGGWDVDGFRGCFVGYCAACTLALATALHARRWGAQVMKETNCCLLPGGAEAKAATAKGTAAKDTAAAVAPGTVSISVAVPAGARAGDKIQIQHEGASYDVTVPAGVTEGQAFVAALPSPAPEVLPPTRDASQNQRLSVRIAVDSLPPADSLRL